MANADIVNGFTPVRRQSGGPMSLERFFVDAGNTVSGVGIGTMMALVTNDSSGVGIPEVIIAGAGAVPIGPVVSFEFDPDAQNRLFLPSSTDGFLFINTSPDLILEVQSDGVFAFGDVGGTADLTDAGVSTVTGASGQEIDESTITAAGEPEAKQIFLIRRLLNREDNALGANALLEVSYNIHAYAPGANIAAAGSNAGNFPGVSAG